MRFFRFAFCAGLFCYGGGRACASTTPWRSIITPHFAIYHEPGRAPSSIAFELERIHGAMRMDMAMFAPWMEKERVKVYIYSSSAAYVAGEFNPRAWSKGVAYVRKKRIVTYDPGIREKLLSVITHELSHLFFESYYGRSPPAWLNEGVAVLMEASGRDKTDSGPWSAALKYAPRKKMRALDEFFDSEVRRGATDEEAGGWYLQAYGIVRFLCREHSRFRFRNLCAMLKDGRQTEKALWEVYRFRNIRAMQEAWLKWQGGLVNTKGDAATKAVSGSTATPERFSSFTRPLYHR